MESSSNPISGLPDATAGCCRSLSPHDRQIEALLDAASAVVLESGIGSLTLDKVAQRVGVSKGGLLHYFKNKDALVSAMVARVVGEWKEGLRAAIDATPPGRTRVLRAMRDGCLAHADEWSDQMRTTSVGVLAAIAEDRKHAGMVREVYAMLREEMSRDGLDDGLGELVMCAMDGLWMSWVFEFRSFSPLRLAAFREALARVIEVEERGAWKHAERSAC